jgi:hypothetical protein
VIGFHLDEASIVSLTVLDMLGRTMLTLINSEQLPSGDHKAHIQSGSLSTGVYLYSLEAEGKNITKRMVVE